MNKDFILALNKIKGWLVFLLFIVFFINTFSSEIKRYLNLKVLNTDIVIRSIEADVLIESALENLRKETKSDRAYIFRFHNGVQYYDGTHKSKMSCDYEVVRPGVSREAEKLQDIPTGLYATWLKRVIKKDMFVPNVSTMTDVRTKQTLESQGIKALAIAPYYRNGKIVALIGVDYIRNVNDNELKKFKANELYEKELFISKTQFIGDLLK